MLPDPPHNALPAIVRVAATPARARFDGVDYLLLRATLAPGLACTLATHAPARLSVVPTP